MRIAQKRLHEDEQLEKPRPNIPTQDLQSKLSTKVCLEKAKTVVDAVPEEVRTKEAQQSADK
eukprot:4627839-Prorocentrum_lima.AAC.1